MMSAECWWNLIFLLLISLLQLYTVVDKTYGSLRSKVTVRVGFVFFELGIGSLHTYGKLFCLSLTAYAVQ